MNKKIICLIAAAVLMLCFTACTKSVNNNVTNIYRMAMKILQGNREDLRNLRMIHGNHSVMSRNLRK